MNGLEASSRLSSKRTILMGTFIATHAEQTNLQELDKSIPKLRQQ